MTPMPASPYAVHKLSAEHYARVYFDLFGLETVSLRFFNVYGPRQDPSSPYSGVISIFMAKAVSNQVPVIYGDGSQSRDFVYVKDVVSVCLFLMMNKPENGLYNLGTGQARTFFDLTKATFRAMGQVAHISYVPTPEDIRDKYQYFTEADMTKLLAAGYDKPFASLEEGVADYVKNYLSDQKYY